MNNKITLRIGKTSVREKLESRDWSFTKDCSETALYDSNNNIDAVIKTRCPQADGTRKRVKLTVLSSDIFDDIVFCDGGLKLNSCD